MFLLRRRNFNRPGVCYFLGSFDSDLLEVIRETAPALKNFPKFPKGSFNGNKNQS